VSEAKTPEEPTSPAPDSDTTATAAGAAAATAAKATPRCRNCGTPLADDQRWCLECGAARTPSRWRSGRRPLALTSALTIGLLGVAAAAGYAAIVDESPVAPTATVAQAPPPPAPIAEPTDTTGDATASDDFTTPSDSTATPSGSSTDATAGGTYTPPPTSSGTGSSSSGSTSDDPGTDTVVKPKPPATTTTTTTTTTPTPPVQQPISLDAGDLALYDPEQHQQAANGGDPGAAIDTAGRGWVAKTDPALPQMDVGLVVDLGKGHGVGKVRFRTATPGFSVQIYGSYTADTPPTIDDSRWAFVKGRKNVGRTTADGSVKGGEQIIKIADDTQKYKKLLIWITKAPAAGPPATIRALKLFD